MNKQNLYLFLHIPKTSGETFKCNIEDTLSQNAVIRSSFTYNEEYFDFRVQKKVFFQGEKHFESYLQDLSDTQKNQVQFICGHDTYYGMHKHFYKHPRYITFVRNPIDRTISLYNFEKMAWGILSQKKGLLNPMEQLFLKRIRENFLIENKAPAFECWLDEVYDKKHAFYASQTRYLQIMGYLDGEMSSSVLMDALNKFYFIGIAENHDVDALYLYDKFSVRTFNALKNDSPSYIKQDKLDKKALDKIIKIKNLKKHPNLFITQ
jgi:hypothetical protein